MGCFLGCFGGSTKRKRRKPANRILPGPADSRFVRYEPLDSSNYTDVDIPEDSLVSKSQLSYKPKIRKKVSFNLNVQTYEPIPDEETTTYQFLKSVEEEEYKAKNGGESVSSSLQMNVYPSNYRYQNCRDSFDEEDEMLCEESDLEEQEEEYDDDDEFESLNMDEDKSKNQMSVGDSTDGNARIRSQYICSVLNPVENTTQWKDIKARAAYSKQKENVAVEEEPELQSKPLLQDVAVDASLSNWLISPKKSISDRRSGEDRVILDITNL
ncbi:uncharacterized protein LOC120119201 [Hibiscus syriacus]|uniref:uncharacterized protein LOC120119201 n=1 Tax=Hibiscus syriacus TaxID=106335 RepID=UPI001924CFCC|nr:uncharacterized protein LOC120119201 [Hibiscus syriacus]